MARLQLFDSARHGKDLLGTMKLTLALAGSILIVLLRGTASEAAPPLKDPVFLNIGFVCHWQHNCMQRQQRAMRRALAYVNKHRPPTWKVQLCNRNASRRRGRVDWIGYEHCIRNPALRPPPARTRRRR